MCFNPKEACKSAKILSSGETSHHQNLTIMRMKLPDGNTVTTNADNTSVIGPNFSKVFCAYFPVEWYTLDEVMQKDIMQEIDQPISWDEL